MNRFGSNVKHIIDCKGVNEELVTRVKSMRLSYRYRKAAPHLFPLADFNLLQNTEERKKMMEEKFSQFNVIESVPGSIFRLWPVKK